MKVKLAAIAALVLVFSLALTGCTPVAAPQPTASATQAPEATAEAAPTAASAKTYIVATDATWPPMEFVDENKEIVGFDADLLKAIAERKGFQVELKNTAWDGIFAGLENGEYDAIISSVTITDERVAQYDFSEPYLNAGQIIIVRIDETEINGAEDLAGKTAGAQLGTTGAFAIEEIEGAVLVEYDTIDLALPDLDNGVIDAVVCDTPVASDYVISSESFKGKFKLVGAPLTEELYGFLVKKGENAELLQLFNEGLAELKADGTYDEIYNKWIMGK